jgi:hypothetical protein
MHVELLIRAQCTRIDKTAATHTDVRAVYRRLTHELQPRAQQKDLLGVDTFVILVTEVHVWVGNFTYYAWIVAGFPPRRPEFDPRSGHVGFVVNKVALGHVYSEYFGFPCQSSFHQLLHNHHRSYGAGTIGQQWPTYQVDSVSPHPEKLKKKLLSV